MKKRWPILYKWLKKLTIFSIILIILGMLTFYLLDMLFPFPVQFLQSEQYSCQIYDSEQYLLMSFLDEQGQWHFSVPLSDISPMMRKAMVSAEDKNFYRHSGVDYWALGRAVIGNITKLWVFSGASTITTQTIRLMEPRPRTILSKIIEVFRAWQLERIWSKDQILEYYFNHTPYGGNLIGIEAAARNYFDKRAKDLTLSESALLAGLPQSPSGYRPDRYLKKALVRRNYTLRRLREDGHITPEEENDVRQQTPIINRLARHISAAHWCFMLRKQYPTVKEIQSTLNWEIQQIAERHLGHGLLKYSFQDIRNGAVIISDNRQHTIVAWVGSADFFADNIQGQINGGNALRSLGSLAKPFTFALAFDHGWITNDSILYDLEFVMSDYRPNNFDRKFRGLVTARTALRDSLNIPVIRLQQKIGTEKLLKCYQHLGFKNLNKPAENYGLTLTLGTWEASLLELVTAYSIFANDGQYFPMRFLKNGQIVSPTPIFSPEACYLVNDILKDADTLAEAGLYISPHTPPFAWKTGTSSGNRDAWTILYNPDYTIGVWMGNFNNRGCKNLVGIEVAAPIAYQIFVELMQLKKNQGGWFKIPSGLEIRKICPTSGDTFQEGICPQKQEGYVIRNKFPDFMCRVHVQEKVSSKKGWVICHDCPEDDQKDTTTRIFQKWPNYVLNWLQKNGGGTDIIPPHNPNCLRKRNTEIVITKPGNESQFTLVHGEDQQIELQAISENNQKLYWFENGRFLKETSSGMSILYKLKKGEYELTCGDTEGESYAKVKIRVK